MKTKQTVSISKIQTNRKKIITFLIIINSIFANAQWNSANGTSLGGSFSAVESFGNTIYVANGSGVYKSNDDGLNWISFNNSLNYSQQGFQVNAMKVNGTNLYLATSIGLYAANLSTGIWYEIENVLPISPIGATIYSLAFNGNQIFVGAWNGLYTSNDNGVTWIQLSNHSSVMSILFENNNLYFTGYYGDILKSTDLGTTWTTISNGIPSTDGNSAYRYKHILKNNGKLFVSLGSINGYSNKIFSSVDEGQNWVENNTNNVGYINSIFKSGTDLFLSCQNVLKKSTNNGLIWTNVSSVPTSYSDNLGCSSGSKIVLASKGFYQTDAAVLISDDGGLNWRKINGNLFGIDLNSVQFLSSSSKIITSSLDKIYTSSFDCNDWNDGVYGSKITSTGTVIYKSMGMDGNGFNSIYSSIDGYNWTLKNNNQVVGDIVMIKAIGSTIYASTVSSKLYRSVDNGVTWTLISTIPSVNNILKDGNTLYLTSGTVLSYNDVYKSIDNGVNWVSIRPNNLLNYISTAVLKGSDLYIGTAQRTNGIISSQGIFKTTSGGTIWSLVNNGLGTLLINDIIQANNILYAICGNYVVDGNETSRNIYMSANDGLSWQLVSPPYGIPNKLATDGTYLYCCSINNGLWRTSISSLNSTGFSLASKNEIIIYPNPTNSKISIDCGSQSNLIGSQIKITDALGQDIYNSILNQSVFEISLGSIATSGLYIIHITDRNGKTISTKKVILQ